ncbi:MAG: hydantoinase B/oxoprolinase family protein, partial [Acetobacteraceae bacterium]|nr:hydantoinase B/oxoprolinase family protein [Acetobacteraceae bacterium]
GMHNNSNIPIEMIESQMPLTVTHYRLREGSGGAGMRRGGLGLVREWRIDSPRALFTANMDRFVHAPFGLAGGGAAATGRLTLIRGGVETPLPPKSDNVPLAAGDRVRLETSGGGGFGDPAARDPALAARDVAMGYVRA